MTTEPESDAAKGRRLVRELFAAKDAVVDAVNERGLHATAEVDAHFDQCESALADWEAETPTPSPSPSDARLREIERASVEYMESEDAFVISPRPDNAERYGKAREAWRKVVKP